MSGDDDLSFEKIGQEYAALLATIARLTGSTPEAAANFVAAMSHEGWTWEREDSP